MTYEDINLKTEGAVAIAEINRPKCLNAFRKQTFLELAGVLEQTASANSIRVLIITGTGRAFSSGKDLNEVDADHAAPDVGASNRAELEQLQEITRRMLAHPCVLFAAVNGPAVGFGAELSLNCDIRLASQSASFAFIEARRGLFPTNAAHFLLPRLIGQGRAAEMLLSGRTVSAAETGEWGFVNRVVADERLMDATLEIAHAIARNAPITVRESLRLLRESHQFTLEDVLIREMDATMRCLSLGDVAEGAQAFFEKREPRFKGEEAS